MWLLLVLFAVGGGLVAASNSSSSSGERAPSGRAWPAGVTTAMANKTIAYALANERDTGKLRDFARELQVFDRAAAQTLNDRALRLDAAATGAVSIEDPALAVPVGALDPNAGVSAAASSSTPASVWSSGPLSSGLGGPAGRAGR